MKVFLGNSPWSTKGMYGVRAGSRWPHFENQEHEYMPFPFFLAYATAVLEQDDQHALLVDAIAERLSDEEFYDRIVAFDPGLILLEVSTSSIKTDIRHWRKIRELVGPDVKIALSGIHHMLQDPVWLEENPEIDYIFVGEYEYTLRDLVRNLESGTPLDGVKGLNFRKDGVPTSNGRRPLLKNIDEIPWPARHMLPMFDYRDEPGSIARPSVQMWASRGCPYRCSFCAWPQIMYGGFKYRTRDVVDVIDETEWLVREWGFKSVYYDDDTFNIGKKRMLQFCNEFKQRQLNIPWAIMARIDGMDAEVLEAMAGSGLAALKYGVETSEQSIIDTCGKRLDISKVRDVVGMTHSLGIKTHLTFMFGLPGETRDTAMRTIDLAMELMPESLQFTLATPFPGSNLYDQLVEEGKIRTLDFDQYDGFHTAVVSTDSLSSSELEEILAEANQRWGDRFAKRTFDTSGEDLSAQELEETTAEAGDDAAVEAAETAEVETAEAGTAEAGTAEAPQPPRALATVIIPNYNGESVLRDCLASVKKQTYKPLQIIVVDDASTDQSVMIAEQFFQDIEVIRCPENRGFAATVNAGIAAARGKYIAILNNDAKAEPGWLAIAINTFSRFADVGMVASKVLTMDTPPRVYSVGVGVTRSGYTFNIGQGTPETGQFNEGRQVLGASGAAAVYRREVFEIVGGFDEDLGHYLEDVDLSLRAQLEGIRCYYEPGAVVQHWGASASGGQGGPLMVKQVSRNTIGILFKDFPRSIISRNLFRVGGSLTGQLVFNVLTGRGGSTLAGLWEGLQLSGQMAAKRKRVLGHQKVPDQRMLELLVESEGWLRETAAELPKVSRARIRLMGVA